MTYSSSYANETRRLYVELSRAKAQANLFRGLLSETDSRLRQAWQRQVLPDGVIPADLIERTRAALAGEPAKALTVSEAIDAAADELAQLGGTRL